MLPATPANMLQRWCALGGLARGKTNPVATVLAVTKKFFDG